MKTTTTITIELPDDLVENTVKSILENYPEAGQGLAIQCTRWNYDNGILSFRDAESGKAYRPKKEDFIKAFPLIYSDKWPAMLPKPPFTAKPEDWDNWLCTCDAFAFDAFIQLVLLGEVIYG
jgi:hypothetical protein